MKKILDSINIYPQVISFSYKDKNLFYSLYGLILSFFSYILIIFLINHFTIDMIRRENPKLKSTQSKLVDSEKMKLSDIIGILGLKIEVKFTMKNNMQYKDKIFGDEVYFYIEINDKIANKTEKYVLGNFTEKFEEISVYPKNEFDGNLYISLYPNKTKLKKYSQKNQIMEPIEYSLNELEFFLKDSSIYFYYEFSKPENVEKYDIYNGFIEFQTIDYAIDVDNYEKPAFESSFNTSVSLGDYMKLKYDYVQIFTDSNPFFTAETNQTFPQIDFFYIDNGNIDDDEYKYQKILKIEFRDIKVKFNRTYKKILDVISELGGIFNPIIILGKFLVSNFNEKKYKLSLLNSLFTDDDISREIKKKQKIFDNQEFDKRKISIINKLNDSKIKIINLYDENLQNKINQKNEGTWQEMVKIIKDKKNINDSNRSLIQEQNLVDHSIIKNLAEEGFNESKLSIYNKNDFKELNKPTLKNNANNTQLFSEGKINNDSINNPSKDEMIISQMKDEKTKSEIASYLSMKKNLKNKLLIYTNKNIFMSLTCGKRIFTEDLHKKEHIYKKILKKLNSYFEITNLMKLYENFEKMKFVLFNKNQMHCFDNMIHDVNFNNQINEEEDLYDLIKYFQKENENFFEKNIKESIKIILKNDFKKLVIKE